MPISRDRLKAFLKDPRTIKDFENLGDDILDIAEQLFALQVDEATTTARLENALILALAADNSAKAALVETMSGQLASMRERMVEIERSIPMDVYGQLSSLREIVNASIAGGSVAGFPSTKSISNTFSAGGDVATACGLARQFGGIEIATFALVAGIPLVVLNIVGAGEIPYLAAYSKNATSRKLTLMVVIDGVTVFNAQSGAIAGANNGISAAGFNSGAAQVLDPPIRFNSSLLVSITSTIADAIGNVALGYSLHQTA